MNKHYQLLVDIWLGS